MLKKNLKTTIIILAGILLSSALISGCSLLNAKDSPANEPKTAHSSNAGEGQIPEMAAKTPAAPDPESEAAVPTSEPSPTAAATETAEPTPEIHTISLWIPPQFDPGQGTNAGKALAAAIDSYTAEHPNVSISLRVKATSGDSSALNTITAANHIAPDVLPSLALLSRSDMETAVQRGILEPITTSVFSDSSTWYGYARQSAVIDGTVYGLPILGDSLVITYKTARIGAELSDWNDILTRGLPIGFAPSSSTSHFGTFIYLTQGGMLTNDQGQPWLDQQKLTDTLNFFLTGGQNGSFPPSLAQLVDDAQVWQRFNDGTMSIIVSRFSSFRHYQTPEISVHAIPVPEDHPDYPLVNTWNLVMLEDKPLLQKEAIGFAEYLCDILVNDSFSQTAGYLPVRKSDHQAWSEDPQFDMIRVMSENAVLLPVNQVTNKIVPVINAAVSQIIKNQQTPETAAQEAITALN